MKVIITEIQYGRAIDSYISDFLEPYQVKISKSLPNHIFWVKDGKVIVGIDKDEEMFYLDHKIWGDITNIFDISYDETRYVIKIWLEKHYDLGKLHPASLSMWLWNNKIFLRNPK